MIFDAWQSNRRSISKIAIDTEQAEMDFIEHSVGELRRMNVRQVVSRRSVHLI